jgi:hypothetical protein
MELEQDKPTDTADDAPVWGWRGIGAVLALVLVGSMVIILAVRALSSLLGQDLGASGMASPALYIAGSAVYGLLLLGIYLFAVRRTSWRAVGWRPASTQDLFFTTPLVLVLAFSGMILINLIIVALQGEAIENPQIEALTGGKPLTPFQLVLLFVLVAGMVPVAEELFFRGMIYPVLRYQWGSVAAIVGSAAIFAVVHVSWVLIPGLFFVGLNLALLREWSKSVIPGIVLHVIQNSLALLAINAALSTT